MFKKNSWKMDLHDVADRSIGSISSGRPTSKWTKQPSSMDIKSKNFLFTHIPTNISVSGIIPAGHYSKKEMNKMTLDLKSKLLQELEMKVARYLRIPGMSY